MLSPDPSVGPDLSTNVSGNINCAVAGTFGIGSPDFSKCTDYKLAVNGKIIATELKVKLASNWPDYVFADNYKLLDIDSLAKFIKQNKHLPDMPLENDVASDGGIEIGDMNVKILKKIEELTLYIVQLKKENKMLDEKINLLQSLLK